MKHPFIPEDAPFTGDQKSWLAGFKAGLESAKLISSENSVLESDSVNKDAPSVNILYGTQTGNAEGLAMDAANIAKANGINPIVNGFDDITIDDFSSMDNVVVSIATYGEGEMPDSAQLFWEALSSEEMKKLPNMKFAVLALGDTGYDEFCQAGKLLDRRLEQLGATRLIDRIDCDVDYEDLAEDWLNKTIPLTSKNKNKTSIKAVSEGAKKTKWTRKNPYPSILAKNILLSQETSAKEIRHYEFDLGDSEITYEAGDALNVMPVNDEELVRAILSRLNIDNSFMIEAEDQSFGDLLKSHYEIMTPSKDLINAIVNLDSDGELSHLMNKGDKDAINHFLWGKDTLDLLNLNKNIKFSPQEFINLLRPLQHRAYSISSSPNKHPGFVHLTVASVRWQNEDREHKGVCSTYLADRLNNQDKAGIFISKNKSFSIPSDDDAPMIMIGPGTGIAPFRAFLEEREFRQASGDNWLFFGDQTRSSDFIYEQQLKDFQRTGLLNQLDLAFSRDQKEKIYVQHRMLEKGEKLFSWLERGGYFYVCGDASRMAHDVDKALHDLVSIHGKYSTDEAIEYVNNLKRDKRYLRDVY